MRFKRKLLYIRVEGWNYYKSQNSWKPLEAREAMKRPCIGPSEGIQSLVLGCLFSRSPSVCVFIHSYCNSCYNIFRKWENTDQTRSFKLEEVMTSGLQDIEQTWRQICWHIVCGGVVGMVNGVEWPTLNKESIFPWARELVWLNWERDLSTVFTCLLTTNRMWEASFLIVLQPWLMLTVGLYIQTVGKKKTFLPSLCCFCQAFCCGNEKSKLI